MRRTGAFPAFITSAFMDSGRISDEFEPDLRRRFRADALLLLAIGWILIGIGIVVALLFQHYVIAVILLVVGALPVVGVVILWWASK